MFQVGQDAPEWAKRRLHGNVAQQIAAKSQSKTHRSFCSNLFSSQMQQAQRLHRPRSEIITRGVMAGMRGDASDGIAGLQRKKGRLADNAAAVTPVQHLDLKGLG